MLLSGIARQIGDWAVQSDANRKTLEEALLKGNVGLLDLGAQIATLSVRDVRALHRDKMEVVKPLSERVHREISNDLLERDVFVTRIQVCAYLHVIYCELFHHEVDGWTGRNRDRDLPLSLETRRIWIQVCMGSCSVGQDGVQSMASTSSGRGSLRNPTEGDKGIIDFVDLIYSPTWMSIQERRFEHSDSRHLHNAITALGHQGMDSLRTRLFLSDADTPRLPSDAKEVLYEAVRSLTRLEEEEVEVPRCRPMIEAVMDYISTWW